MSMMETEETNQFTFEPFAAHMFYTQVNHSLVRQALTHLRTYPRHATFTIVDMACGTGAITRLIVDEMASQGRLEQTQIIGVDPSAEALRRARKSMEGIRARGTKAKTEFVQGEANDLPNIVQNADVAFFCNAIHLVPDKLAAFQDRKS